MNQDLSGLSEILRPLPRDRRNHALELITKEYSRTLKCAINLETRVNNGHISENAIDKTITQVQNAVIGFLYTCVYGLDGTNYQERKEKLLAGCNAYVMAPVEEKILFINKVDEEPAPFQKISRKPVGQVPPALSNQRH